LKKEKEKAEENELRELYEKELASGEIEGKLDRKMKLKLMA